MIKNFSGLNIIEEDDEDSFLVDSLLEASDEGNLEELRDLLEGGHTSLNANSHNKHQETALHFSSSSGHVEVVEYLVEMGADVNSKDKHSETPLYWAARQGNVQVVEGLVNKGAMIDAANELGQTALIAAVKNGRLDMVEVLCALKADVNYSDMQGETVAHSIAWGDLPSQHCDVICSLNNLDLNAKNNNNETALHISAGRGNISCLESLVKYGADVNCYDKRISTPLHLACHCQHILIVKQLLLSNKIDLNAVDQNGDTPLHVVSQSGLLKVVQLLCWHGCHVDAVNKAGKTALHSSARLGHTEVVRCLLLRGASINCPVKNGVTAQMMAVARGKNATAELLAKLTPEKQAIAIRQLVEGVERVGRVKMKVFGCSGVGKSRLVQALQTGFFGKLFYRKSYIAPTPPSSHPFQTPPPSSSSSFSSIPSIVNQESNNQNDNKSWGQQRSSSRPTPVHPSYTRGIHVQNCSISGGVGELSVWEFSGYESYMQFYDMFIGDVKCVHMVCFDPFQSGQKHKFKMVNYWLDFLKSRIPTSEPIGKEGQLQCRAQVVLVAIVNGLSKTQMGAFEEGEESFKQLQELCLCMKNVYKMDLEIHPRVFIVDPTHPSSLKPLKTCLSDLKKLLCQSLPTTSAFLATTIAALPAWRAVLSGYPVVTWRNFMEYVRSSVNLLCGEEHLKELIYKLQIMGEVAFIETREGEDDLVVLDVNWLCNGVLGSLLSHDSSCNRAGCYGIDTFQFLLPDYEAGEVLHLLQAMGLSSRCDLGEKEEEDLYEGGKLENKKKSLSVLELNSLPSGDNKDFVSDYEIPSLNFMSAHRTLWEQMPSETAVNVVYAGSRYRLSCPFCHLENSPGMGGTLRTDSSVSPSSTSSSSKGGSQRNGRLDSGGSMSEKDLSLISNQTSKIKTSNMASLLPSYLIPHLSSQSKDGCQGRSEYNQLSQVFTRIQHEMKKQQVDEGFPGDVENYLHASKCCKGGLEVMMTYEEVRCGCCVCNKLNQSEDDLSKRSASSFTNDSSPSLCHCGVGCIEVKCRGPSDMACELFEFLKHTKEQVETSISMCCPSLSILHQVMSSTHLSEHRVNITSFAQQELLDAFQHSGVDAVLCHDGDNGNECVESLIDLLAFGSLQVFESITFTTDLPLSHLGLQTRRRLASLLDPIDQTGCDWCMLAIMLGLSDQVPHFDSLSTADLSSSKTNRIFQLLNELTNKPSEEANNIDDISCNNLNNRENNIEADKINAKPPSQLSQITIGALIGVLRNLGRHDAVEVLYTTCPLTLRPDSYNHEGEDDYEDNFNIDEGDYNAGYKDNNSHGKNGYLDSNNNDSDRCSKNAVGGYEGLGKLNGELHKDDGSTTSDEINNDEDMYIDDNYGDYGGEGDFEGGVEMHVSEAGNIEPFV